MKKNITIKNIDVDLYNQIKQRAEAEAVSVSDFITSLFTKELSEVPSKDQSEEIITLKAEKEKVEEFLKALKTQLEEKENALEEIENFKKEYNLLHQENYDLSEKNKQLQTQLQAYKDQEEQILTITSGEIRVSFDELELALLNFVCERETKRVNQEITPEKLLNKMFVNHAVKGDMYFFKQPTRAEIYQLKENLEKQKKYGEE